jgi:DNA-binding TFAR19-related protein (PDSD5 family)
LDEDLELKMINARKLAEMRRRAERASAAAAAEAATSGASAHSNSSKKGTTPQKSSRDIVAQALYDRGDEVLQTAYDTYPRQTEIIVEQLARLLSQGGSRERISGGELYALFRNLGLRFSLRTTIKVQDKGRFIDLKDKLKMDMEG